MCQQSSGIEEVITQLENNKLVFENLLKNKTKTQYLRRPESEKWCLLEVVCHLLDEEIYDFRARVKHAIETPLEELVPINPEGWVVQHDYASKDYDQNLKAFLSERNTSIIWLKSLNNKNWKQAVKHPELGKLSAELFLRNWLAHDYLHIRQILNYKYNFLKSESEIDLSYAGNW